VRTMDEEWNIQAIEAQTRLALQRAAERAKKMAQEGSIAADLTALAAKSGNVGRAPFPELLVAMLLDTQGRQIEILEERIRRLEA
jgi:hypothetical protein